MRVTLHLANRDNPVVIEEVDRILAATESFQYWAIWYPEDTDGKTRVRFIPERRVNEIELLGEQEGQEGPKLASVTPIKGGDPIGSVQED